MVVRASLVGILVVIAAFVAPQAAAAKVRTYAVSDVRDLLDRSKVTVAGAAIVEVQHREVVVTANRRTVRRLKRLGFTVERIGASGTPRGKARAAAFPAADAAYHDYAEMAAEVQSTAAAYPALVSRFSLGPPIRGARSGPRRCPITSASTRPSRRSCSAPTSTPGST